MLCALLWHGKGEQKNPQCSGSQSQIKYCICTRYGKKIISSEIYVVIARHYTGIAAIESTVICHQIVVKSKKQPV